MSPSLEQINISAAGSADQSSGQTFIFGSKEEIDNFPSISNQGDGNVMSQQENERAAVFDLTTPLADLESDVFFFVCPPQYPLLQRYSFRVADKGLHQGRSSASTSSSHSTLPPGLNALQKAVIKSRDSIAELLIENGAEVYIVDEYGNTILHLAAQYGHASLISFGLSHCVNVNAINVAGETPLHVAIEHDFVEIVDMLVRAGADMEFKS